MFSLGVIFQVFILFYLYFQSLLVVLFGIVLMDVIISLFLDGECYRLSYEFIYFKSHCYNSSCTFKNVFEGVKSNQTINCRVGNAFVSSKNLIKTYLLFVTTITWYEVVELCQWNRNGDNVKRSSLLPPVTG